MRFAFGVCSIIRETPLFLHVLSLSLIHILNITTDKLGWSSIRPIDVLNIKCEPTMIGAFRKEPGIYAAYHMNKANWLTVSLDGSVPTERIKMLLDMSYRLTK